MEQLFLGVLIIKIPYACTLLPPTSGTKLGAGLMYRTSKVL